MEEIKDVKGWEDYTIDTDGNVFSKRKNKYLKQTINKYGYCKSRDTKITITSISYNANGKRKTGGGYIWHFV